LKNEKKPPKGFEKFFKKKEETTKSKGMCKELTNIYSRLLYTIIYSAISLLLF